MHLESAVIWIFVWNILSVSGRRDLYDTKCTRKCNTEEGSYDCWKDTTDGFAYGLSTAMVDYCQVILKIRNLTDNKESWYDISRNILTKQIEQYELEDEVRQLTKENIEQIATTLLDQCFNASSSLTSSEPPCPSCSADQTKHLKSWRISSIILMSIACFLVFLIFLFYALHTYHIRRSYTPIK